MAVAPETAAPVAPESQPVGRKPRHRTRNLAIVVVVVAIAVALLCLFTIPVPHSFSLSFVSSPSSLGNATLNPPKGSIVPGSYTTIGYHGAGLPLAIADVNKHPVYLGIQSAGSFNFTSENPPYTFEGNGGSVSVNGTISYPIL